MDIPGAGKKSLHTIAEDRTDHLEYGDTPVADNFIGDMILLIQAAILALTT